MTDQLLVPDMTEPIVAARAWEYVEPRHIDSDVPRARGRKASGIGPRLGSTGIFGNEPWGQGVNIAACRGYVSRENHIAPQASCSCGFYALASPENVPTGYYRVYGVVHLWGRVIPGEKGWRAQYAQITGLILPEFFRSSPSKRRHARLAAYEYDVPVLRHWPELTDPKEVARWTSAESSP